MTLALGCIADDYTGASDLANTLTRCGLRTVQTIGVPSDGLALPGVDAVVVSLKSRSIEADLAVSRSRAAEKWLRGRGARHVLFKICSTFDSTDAGNIGPVMDALRADCGEPIVLATPAFPETGRTVPHVIKPRRPGDPAWLVADPRAARETLQFQPVHSDLATIVRTAWAWHQRAHPLKMDAAVDMPTDLSPAA